MTSFDGFRFYEEKDVGLGDYFISTLYSEIESLRILAGVHSKPHGDFYRLLSKRFPFAIYYTIDDDVAIVDCRRSPDWIRKHLAKSEQTDAGNRRPGRA